MFLSKNKMTLPDPITINVREDCFLLAGHKQRFLGSLDSKRYGIRIKTDKKYRRKKYRKKCRNNSQYPDILLRLKIQNKCVSSAVNKSNHEALSCQLPFLKTATSNDKNK